MARPVIWLLVLLALLGGWYVYGWRDDVGEGRQASDAGAPAVSEPGSRPAPAAPADQPAGQANPPPAPAVAATVPPEQTGVPAPAAAPPAPAAAAVDADAPEDQPPSAPEDQAWDAPKDQASSAPEDQAWDAPKDQASSAPEDQASNAPEDQGSSAPPEARPAAPAASLREPSVSDDRAASGDPRVPEAAAAKPGADLPRPSASSPGAVDWERLAEIAPDAGAGDTSSAAPAEPALPQAGESGTAELPTPDAAPVGTTAEASPDIPGGAPDPALAGGDEQRKAALDGAPGTPARTEPRAPLPGSDGAPADTAPDAAADRPSPTAEAADEPLASLNVDSIRRAIAALLSGLPEVPDPEAAAVGEEQAAGAREELAVGAREELERPAPTPAEPMRPSFDIVRVERDGRTVVAGRAAPGAEVELRAGDRVLDRVRASRRGEWVATPLEPLPPGGGELTLAARTDDGAAVALSEQVVVVALAEPPPPQPAEIAAKAPPVEPVAVLLPKDGEAGGRVLQAPGRIGSEGHLALLVLDYDHAGQVRLSGEGPPGAPVRVYVDNQPSAEVVVAPSGQWTTVLEQQLMPGDYTLRLDQLGGEGRPVARLETPFTRVRQPPVAGQAQVDHVIVQPGNSLWRIARRLFGDGFAYVHIYDANQAQIRDPDLIYPGQVFEVPVGLAGDAAG